MSYDKVISDVGFWEGDRCHQLEISPWYSTHLSAYHTWSFGVKRRTLRTTTAQAPPAVTTTPVERVTDGSPGRCVRWISWASSVRSWGNSQFLMVKYCKCRLLLIKAPSIWMVKPLRAWGSFKNQDTTVTTCLLHMCRPTMKIPKQKNTILHGSVGFGGTYRFTCFTDGTDPYDLCFFFAKQRHVS